MITALVRTMRYPIPGNLLDLMPPVCISYLLCEQGTAILGMRDKLGAEVVRGPVSVFGHVLTDLNRDAVMVKAGETMSKLLINSAVLVERGGNRPAFTNRTD